MITKEIARLLPHGATLYHVTPKNADGTPMRARKNGNVKTWTTRPDEFHLPMKHGLKHFYIDQDNAHEWTTLGG